MSKRSNYELLTDISEAIEKVFRYTKNMSYEEFIQDDKTIDAVVRNFEIMGEAANKIDKSVKNAFPNIAWKRIIGLRNRVVHEYFGIDLQIVWQIKKNSLYTFYKEINELIAFMKANPNFE